MLAFFSSLQAPAVRRGHFTAWWSRLFPTVLAAKTEDELAEYLERHQHDLPPELWIELERRVERRRIGL
jgi:hypothetical protein